MPTNKNSSDDVLIDGVPMAEILNRDLPTPEEIKDTKINSAFEQLGLPPGLGMPIVPNPQACGPINCWPQYVF